MIYNPQFALGKEGWQCEGDVQFMDYQGSMVCQLAADSAVLQEISTIRNHFESESYQASLF